MNHVVKFNFDSSSQIIAECFSARFHESGKKRSCAFI